MHDIILKINPGGLRETGYDYKRSLYVIFRYSGDANGLNVYKSTLKSR